MNNEDLLVALVVIMAFVTIVRMLYRIYRMYSARKNLQHGSPARLLTIAERKAINQLGNAVGKVRTDKVYRFSGPYVCYTFSYQNRTERHPTINDVPVSLPCNASEYLREMNEVEVVFTHKKREGLILSLNGSFDIVSAVREKSDSSEWLGDSGDPIAGSDVENTPQGVRQETISERRNRYTPGPKLIAAAIFSMALISMPVVPLRPALSSVIFIVLLGIFLLVYRHRRRQPDVPVYRVRGVLWRQAGEFFIGGMWIRVPPEWQDKLTLDSWPMLYEYRPDGYLLSAPGFTVEQNPPLNRYKTHHWVMLATTALVFIMLSFDQNYTKSNWDATLHWLKQDAPVLYNGYQALQDKPVSYGDYIRLSGTARCWPESREYSCRQMLFGAPEQLVDVSDLQLSQTVMDLDKREWVAEGWSDNPDDYRQFRQLGIDVIYRNGRYLRKPEDLIRTVEQTCGDTWYCRDAKQSLAEVFGRREWSELINIINRDDYQDEPVSLTVSEEIKLNGILSYIYKKSVQALINDVRQRLQSAAGQGVLVTAIPAEPEDEQDLSGVELLEAFYRLAGPQGLQPVDIQGIVRRLWGGIELDTRHSPNHPGRFFPYVLVILVLMAVVVWQLLALSRKYRNIS